MSDEIQAQGSEEQGSDSVENVKAEFGRKLENIESQLAQQQQRNDQLLAQLQTVAAAQTAKVETQSSPKEDISDLMYSDPERYTQIITQQATETAKQEALAQVQAMNAEQDQKNAVLQRLVNSYPELADTSSQLVKEAKMVYDSFSDTEKASPLSYEVAVGRAADKIGVQKASKRSISSDEFALPGGGSSSSKKRQERTSIPEPTAAFAEIMGLDLEDKATKERLSALSNSRDWTKYKRRG